MKRQAKPKSDYIIFSVSPWFVWRECRVCKKEFRRERGWRMIGPPICGGRASEFYLCGECAATEKDAIRIGNTRPWMGRMPIPEGNVTHEEKSMTVDKVQAAGITVGEMARAVETLKQSHKT